jgi:hypothetical protein
MLFFSNDLYLQYLEGDGGALEALWARIEADPRHRVEWALRGAGGAARLPGLVMGYFDGDRERTALDLAPLRLAEGSPDRAETVIALLAALAIEKYPSTLGGT